MNWVDIEVEQPRDGQTCLVMCADGQVFKAVADSGWYGGFCRNAGVCVTQVEYWLPFVGPGEKLCPSCSMSVLVRRERCLVCNNCGFARDD